MRPRPDAPCVLVLAGPHVQRDVARALAQLGCRMLGAEDLFGAITELHATEPDAVVIDLTMPRDDARAFGFWLRDSGSGAQLIGLIEPATSVADADVDGLCDELLLVPPSADGLGTCLGLHEGELVSTSGSGAPRHAADDPAPRLSVKVNAVFLEAGTVDVPPREVDTDDGPRRVLLVGTGPGAHPPTWS